MGDLERHWPDWLPSAPRERLVVAYGDPGRGYHDLRHLREVLGHVEEILAAEAEAARANDVQRDTVLLAAWFHDAVYDSGGNLEERSAGLAERVLTAHGTAPALVTEVGRLVRLTSSHEPEDGDLAGQVLCDADLAILAADQTRYAEYVAGVRKEYAHVHDDAFTAGRGAVLRALAAKPTLFHTAYARSRWEAAARDNLTRELTRLTGMTPL
jgi:predicted metal-dependent HD superfamily phosphohydrolase